MEEGEKELNQIEEDSKKYIKLIKIIRKSKNKAESNKAFEEILLMVDKKIKQLISSFNIPGYTKNDLYQEALVALRYKAIKDYNPAKSKIHKTARFDQFAILCIRSYLSTKRKSSFQNKSRVINTYVSLNQDRNNNTESLSDNSLSLSEIISKDNDDLLSKSHKKESFGIIFSKLFQKLSVFEQDVFKLYAKNYSYKEMSEILEKKNYEIDSKCKSIDNALGRIKIKFKEVFKKHGSIDLMSRKGVDKSIFEDDF